MRDPKSFGPALRRARLAAGYSQADLAVRARMQPAHVAHFEAGRQAPSFPLLCRIADALDVRLDDLVVIAPAVGVVRA